MTNWSINGNTLSHDESVQRIAAGTIGDSHMFKSGVGGKSISAVVDDFIGTQIVDYGMFDRSSNTFREVDYSTVATGFINNAFTYGGTRSVLNVANSAVRYKFKGNYVGVTMVMASNTSTFTVYVDGQLCKGKTNVFSSLGNFVLPTDTFVMISPTLASLFASSGEIAIEDEILGYTSVDTVNGLLLGVTHGLYGTKPDAHAQTAAVYQWASTAYSSQTGNGATTRRVTWSNSLLSPGDHTIVIVNDGNGNGKLIFDAFLTRDMIGARNIRSFIGTFYVSFTTDANGHKDFGTLVTYNPDLQIVGFLGFTQLTPTTEASNATAMIRMGIRPTYSTDADPTAIGVPYIYFHNGAANTFYELNLMATYFGSESV